MTHTTGSPTAEGLPAGAPALGEVVLRGRLVLPHEVVEDGALVLRDGRVAWAGPVADCPRPAPEPVPGRTLLPGLVDVHCHGGGGAGFPDVTTHEEALAAVHEHRRHGTTTLVASLVTAARETLLARTTLLADLCDAGELAGIHLEGPFLSPARKGAQDPALMVAGDAALVREVAAAARGHFVTMTVAPDADGVLGADGAIEALAAVGAVPSLGHTDASAEVTREAVAQARDALSRHGARSTRPTATHLFNGMRPLHHRDPGPVAALLAAAAHGEAVVELVADGVHLDEETVRAVVDLLTGGPEPRAVEDAMFVTDAMAAAGMPDGAYRLGTADVVVRDGVARLASDGAIAGGTSHLLDQVRLAVTSGIDLVTAVRMASVVPAGVLGREDVGRLGVGARADVVVTDAALAPVAVLRGGTLVAGSLGGRPA